jgi:hypothetical protein
VTHAISVFQRLFGERRLRHSLFPRLSQNAAQSAPLDTSTLSPIEPLYPR